MLLTNLRYLQDPVYTPRIGTTRDQYTDLRVLRNTGPVHKLTVSDVTYDQSYTSVDTRMILAFRLNRNA